MATIKDIAKMAGVSMTTVSKVVNGKTFDIGDKTVARVQKILDDQNYIPNQAARSMRTNKSMTIGLIIPDIRNPFFTEIARGAEDEAYRNGYNIMLSNSDDVFIKEVSHINSMVQKQVDGILICASNERGSDSNHFLGKNLPTIAIDRPFKSPNLISSITTENTDGAYKAVEYLLKQGHRKILHLAGPKNNEVSISRLNGYVKAFRDVNVDFDERDIIFGEFSSQSGYSALMNLDFIKEYTAIFCSNDMVAFGALSALKEKGILVPEEVSLMGVDDVEYARLVYPSLTTIDQSAYDLGVVSVKEMINHFKGKKIPEKIKLKQHLVIRDSVSSLEGFPK